jgi:hypothetical protein
VYALNQYVEKLNIVLKTFKKTKNIGWYFRLLWCYLMQIAS